MAALKVSPEQLQQAWQACQARRKSDWPKTFEAAMNDRYFAHLVLIQARITVHQAQAREHQQKTRAKALLAAPSHPPILDHKRLAAGDRDD